jgi:hypothetical protein
VARADDFESDDVIENVVMGLVDFAHSAASDQGYDAEPTGEKVALAAQRLYGIGPRHSGDCGSLQKRSGMGVEVDEPKDLSFQGCITGARTADEREA